MLVEKVSKPYWLRCLLVHSMHVVPRFHTQASVRGPKLLNDLALFDKRSNAFHHATIQPLALGCFP